MAWKLDLQLPVQSVPITTSDTPVSSTKETDRHNITAILLKVGKWR
jgi:hypothetical protein